MEYEFNVIKKYYEEKLKVFGANCKGLAWKNQKEVNLRYNIMLDMLYFIKKKNISLLDLGCGFGGLLQVINKRKLSINYTGIDISPIMISEAKKKYPKNFFLCANILNKKVKKKYDFIIMNGIFTVKSKLNKEQMWDFFKKLLVESYSITKKGISFNLMKYNLDWRRNDLFHVRYDELEKFLIKNISKKFIIRSDYPLNEFTTYVFK
jgi:SAM-dependent methyltransferase